MLRTETTAQPHSSLLRGVVNQLYLRLLIRMMQSPDGRLFNHSCAVVSGLIEKFRSKHVHVHVNVLGPEVPNGPLFSSYVLRVWDPMIARIQSISIRVTSFLGHGV